MSKAYLLTGDKGVGKTTALQRIINSVGKERFGGFYAKEVRDRNIRTGFRIVTLDGEEGILADVSSSSDIRVGGPNEKGIGKYGVELDFLENAGLSAINKALLDDKIKFVVVDEIGPMQLFSERFKAAILNILAGSKPLIGTIVLRDYPWSDEFKKRLDVETYLLTPSNRENMALMLTWFFSNQ